MSRASAAGNGVIKAVQDVCGLYGVPLLRMQSRTFTVPGVGGTERPFFVGEWTDAQGVKHRRGMADLLLMPAVHVQVIPAGESRAVVMNTTIPLWCECKAGEGKLETEQKAFRDWVISIGAGYLCITNSCQELMDWFSSYGVKKP